MNASYDAAEGWDVSTTHAQQRLEREFEFPWHAVKSVHEYQNEGLDNEAFEKARERLGENVFESGRAADVFDFGTVMYWLLGGNEPAWMLPALSDGNEKWAIRELKRELERMALSLGNLVGARIGERCWCLRYENVRELSRDLKVLVERLGLRVELDEIVGIDETVKAFVTEHVPVHYLRNGSLARENEDYV